ncbi:MAG: cupin domain-containing protein [Dehalococcoidia bacterium]|nr:cupin domain-containing protein [Dehalococcoidia bacterium]
MVEHEGAVAPVVDAELREEVLERIFVREIKKQSYDLREELRRLRSLPRVFKSRDYAWDHKDGHRNRDIITPATAPLQSLYVHMEALPPGGANGSHGHQNEAMFYILDGRGYEIHDGKRYDWEAGDVVIVNNDCVHQHFNSDPHQPARMLVIKTKPLYMFMHLINQATVERAPETPPEGRDFEPED